MDISLLDTLRYKIDSAKVLADVFEYFFDNFGEVPEFFSMGEPAEDPFLIQLLSHIGGTVFSSTKVKIRRPSMFRIAEYNFIHGGMEMDGAIANVIYFDDIRKGILAIQKPNEAQTRFVRFSSEMLPSNLSRDASKFNQ